MRAATSMFLMSLANILPRRASMTAFLCLVVAPLGGPGMRFLFLRLAGRLGRCCPHLLDEEPVEPVVAGDLGVERCREQVALPDRNDPTDRVSGGDPATTATSAPVFSTQGARMNSAWKGSSNP